MSCYLNIYITPKRKSETEEKKHLILLSYSRSSDVYEYFDHNLDIPRTGKEEKYLVLNKESVELVITDFKEDIKKAETRLTEYEKHVKDNSELIEDIISMKEYIEDLKFDLHTTYFILDLIINNDIYEEFEEISCNFS